MLVGERSEARREENHGRETGRQGDGEWCGEGGGPASACRIPSCVGYRPGRMIRCSFVKCVMCSVLCVECVGHNDCMGRVCVDSCEECVGHVY